MKKGWHVKVNYIPWEQNDLIDAIAHLAQDSIYGCHMFEEPPIKVMPLLQNDQASLEQYATLTQLLLKQNKLLKKDDSFPQNAPWNLPLPQ